MDCCRHIKTNLKDPLFDRSLHPLFSNGLEVLAKHKVENESIRNVETQDLNMDLRPTQMECAVITNQFAGIRVILPTSAQLNLRLDSKRRLFSSSLMMLAKKTYLYTSL